jgi:hypothetical protein
MKFRLQGSVTIPKRPSTVGGLIGWARGVNKTLQELRDRKIVGSIAMKNRLSQLKLTIKQGTAENKFQIIPGTVNSEMPTLDTVALDDSTPPEITVTADTWVWVKCVGTFGDPDTYVITIDTEEVDTVPTGTDISATGFVSFYYIGKIAVTDNSPDPDTYEIENQHGGGNLGVDSWGLYNLWWRA